MINLAKTIAETKVEPGSVAIFWINQASFAYKSPAGSIIYVDPFLPDCTRRMGFIRIMESPISPDEVNCDLLITTHNHADHLDPELIPTLAHQTDITFAGPISCVEEFRKAKIPESQIKLLQKEGSSFQHRDVTVHSVYADHGEGEPHAIGVVLDVAGVKVYQMGDTSYHPEKYPAIKAMGIDVLIPPINGRFGNIGSDEAAMVARDVEAKLVIPCHFWMFAQHNGDPELFLKKAAEYAPAATAMLMTQASCYIYKK